MATAVTNNNNNVLVGKVFNYVSNKGFITFSDLFKSPSPLATKVPTEDAAVIWIKENLSTDKRFAVQEDRGTIVSVKIVSKVRVCTHYVETGDCSSKGSCRFWHVCKDYIEGNCEKTCRGGLSHDFHDTENGRKTEELGFGKHVNGTVRRIVAFSLPQVCSAYMLLQCVDTHCPYLHLCAGFVRKTCVNMHECNQSHDLRSDHNKSVLKKYGLHLSTKEMYILCNILLPKKVAAQNTPVNNIETKQQHDAQSKLQHDAGGMVVNSSATSKPNLLSGKPVFKSQAGSQQQESQVHQSTPHSLNLDVSTHRPDKEDGWLSSEDNESVEVGGSCLLNMHSGNQIGVWGSKTRVDNVVKSKQHTKPAASKKRVPSQLHRHKGISQSVGNVGHSSEGQSLIPPTPRKSLLGNPPGACNRPIPTIPPLLGFMGGPTGMQQVYRSQPSQMQDVVICRGREGEHRSWVGKGRGRGSTSHQGGRNRPGNRDRQRKVKPKLEKEQDGKTNSQLNLPSKGEFQNCSFPEKPEFPRKLSPKQELSSPYPQLSQKPSNEFGAVGQSNAAEKRNFTKKPGQQLGETQPGPAMTSKTDSFASSGAGIASKIIELVPQYGKEPSVLNTKVSYSAPQQPNKGATSSSSCSSKTEPVEISEKQVFECICKEYDCSVKFSDISDRADLFPNGNADAEAWFRKDARKDSFIITEGGNKELIEITAFSSKLRICYNGSNCSKAGCNFFHVCRHFIAGCCTSGATCTHDHEFRNHKDKQLVSSLKILNSFTEEQLGCLFRTSTPHVCLDYNNGKCQKGTNCNKIHICKNFVLKHCRVTHEECSLSHDNAYETPHTKALAEKFRMSILTLKRVVMVEQPPRGQLTELGHVHQDGGVYICPDFILGQCIDGAQCVKHHCSLPYQWQYKDQAGDQTWLSWGQKDNENLEKAYCDPSNNNNYKIKLNKTPLHSAEVEMVLDFENMTMALPLLHLFPMHIRRLSTESYAMNSVNPVATAWTWYWKDEYNLWEKYGNQSGNEKDIQRRIEEAFVDPTNAWYDYSSTEHPYVLYFREKPMYQKNQRFDTERMIRRRPQLQSKDEIEQLIKNGHQHQSQVSQGGVQPRYPPHWSRMPQGKEFERVSLPTDSKEFVKVKNRFHETMPKEAKILIKIERVQNPFMWDRFSRKKKNMMTKYCGSSLEKDLFHGTSPHTVENICKQNFDWRLYGKNATMYGQGSYFALNSSYSDSYARRQGSHDSSHFMFLANVLVGSYVKGDSNMRRPPPKNPFNSASDLFDSCVDNEDNPEIFVVFETDQCYPLYVIEYMDIVQSYGVSRRSQAGVSTTGQVNRRPAAGVAASSSIYTQSRNNAQTNPPVRASSHSASSSSPGYQSPTSYGQTHGLPSRVVQSSTSFGNAPDVPPQSTGRKEEPSCIVS